LENEDQIEFENTNGFMTGWGDTSNPGNESNLSVNFIAE